MRGTIAITDYNWYKSLLPQKNLDEVNFWTPSSYFSYRGNVGEPFFFKLKSRYDHAICGFGLFAKYAKLPLWLAWDSFREKNGCDSLDQMQRRIVEIREGISFKSNNLQNDIGCILISQPVFFSEPLWIQGPDDWRNANLRYAFYSLLAGEGKRIFDEAVKKSSSAVANPVDVTLFNEDQPMLGNQQTFYPRLGQGTFRISVMEAYQKSCAITNEHSLPVLEAAHIKPFSEAGPNKIENGLLLRSDLHKLFDTGYITITDKFQLEVSSKLKEDYNNGKVYYKLNGTKINLPKSIENIPSKEFIEYHNTHIYRG